MDAWQKHCEFRNGYSFKTWSNDEWVVEQISANLDGYFELYLTLTFRADGRKVTQDFSGFITKPGFDELRDAWLADPAASMATEIL